MIEKKSFKKIKMQSPLPLSNLLNFEFTGAKIQQFYGLNVEII